MSRSITCLLIIVAAGLLIPGCIKTKPQSILLQGMRMQGHHRWHGTETDHLLPAYPDYRPAHDTTYDLHMAFSFYFQGDTYMYMYEDTLSDAPYFSQLSFTYTSHDETRKILTYTFTDTMTSGHKNLDTLFYDYAHNTISLHRFFEFSSGTYTFNIATP